MLHCSDGQSVGGVPDVERSQIFGGRGATQWTQVDVRALRTDDRADLLDAVERTSAQSLYRRFFGAKRDFSQKEIEFFLNIDFVKSCRLGRDSGRREAEP